MMNYTNYSVEEFIQDAYFRQWAFDELSSDDTFWETWIQLNPEKVMLVISHSDNTFDKNVLRESPNPMLKETTMKVRDFIKDKELREFYSSS